MKYPFLIALTTPNAVTVNFVNNEELAVAIRRYKGSPLILVNNPSDVKRSKKELFLYDLKRVDEVILANIFEAI